MSQRTPGGSDYQEGFNYQAFTKRVSPYSEKNPQLFLDFMFNIRNALGVTRRACSDFWRT